MEKYKLDKDEMIVVDTKYITTDFNWDLSLDNFREFLKQNDIPFKEFNLKEANKQEDDNTVTCCSHCFSLAITMEGDNSYCNNCGTLGFTEIITEEEYQEKVKVNC